MATPVVFQAGASAPAGDAFVQKALRAQHASAGPLWVV